MHFYFFLIRIAAFFGHRRARRLVHGQAQAFRDLKAYAEAHPERMLRDCVWFHAASVGEFEQARPIIERLREEQPWRPILLTFFSPSGYEMRKTYDKVDLVTYLPFATRRNARRFIEAVHPSMAVFVKYEFWPAYIRQLHQRNIPLYSVASIFRSNQYFFRWYGAAERKLLKMFTHLFVQDNASIDLLRRYGITQTSLSGDTRFDRVTSIAGHAKEIEAVRRFVEGQPQVIVAGSTWPEDEALLYQYMEEHPYVRLILVPHEINQNHLHSIFHLWQGKHVLLSDADELNLQHTRTLVVNRMGLLSSIYQYGHVAYVGGGFGAGIHNTIEAAVYGLPVIFGPNYEHFREAKALIENGGGRSVSDYPELAAAIDDMLQNRQTAGLAAARYVESELGATDRIYSELFGKKAKKKNKSSDDISTNI